MTKPIPAAQTAAENAQAVVAFEPCVLIAPLTADHLTPAWNRKHASVRLRRELAEEQREVACRTDKSAGRSKSVGRVVAWDCHTSAQEQLVAMTACHWRGRGHWHVGICLLEAGRIDDLAFDPGSERLTC